MHCTRVRSCLALPRKWIPRQTIDWLLMCRWSVSLMARYLMLSTTCMVSAPDGVGRLLRTMQSSGWWQRHMGAHLLGPRASMPLNCGDCFKQRMSWTHSARSRLIARRCTLARGAACSGLVLQIAGLHVLGAHCAQRLRAIRSEYVGCRPTALWTASLANR